jgi:hypothetical protein
MGKFDNHGLMCIITGNTIPLIHEQVDPILQVEPIPIDGLFQTRYYAGIRHNPVVHEPTRTNRFVVEFPIEFGIDISSVKSVTMPTWTLENGWGDMVVTFYEFIEPSATRSLFYNLVALEELRQFEMSISLLDPVGSVIRKWTINVDNVISINFGGIHNYGEDGIGEITMKLRINTCVLNF